MRTKRILLSATTTLLFSLFLVISEGCKKEKRIEKNLYSDGGKWNISKLYQSHSSNVNPGDYFEINLSDCGHLIFRENGTGTLTLNLPGESTEISEFSYKVISDTKLSLDIEGEKREFTMEWKKNNIKLENIETNNTGSGEIITEILRLELNKI